MKSNRIVRLLVVAMVGMGLIFTPAFAMGATKPKAPVIKYPASTSKSVTVKWKKVAKYADGYQIKYATNKNFTNNDKTVLVEGKDKVSKKITKVKTGKKYYVKVRAYNAVNGKKYYSKWSETRVITTWAKSPKQKTVTFYAGRKNSEWYNTVKITYKGDKVLKITDKLVEKHKKKNAYYKERVAWLKEWEDYSRKGYTVVSDIDGLTLTSTVYVNTSKIGVKKLYNLWTWWKTGKSRWFYF